MTEYVIVPKVVTEEMAEAGDDGYYGTSPYEIWEAMLAAAPKWEPNDEDVERALNVYCRSIAEQMNAQVNATKDDLQRTAMRAVLETLGRE